MNLGGETELRTHSRAAHIVNARTEGQTQGPMDSEQEQGLCLMGPRGLSGEGDLYPPVFRSLSQAHSTGEGKYRFVDCPRSHKTTHKEETFFALSRSILSLRAVLRIWGGSAESSM